MITPSARPSIEFNEFPKIARLSREIIVTEKIDGTNAQIYIPEADFCECGHNLHGVINHGVKVGTGEFIPYSCPCTEFKPSTKIYTGSRTKWITPEDDNMGFAKWVQKNREELLRLGPGFHFGEWWGQGIQRSYGLKEKRFSLFNTFRWGPGGKDEVMKPACCGVVPVLHQGAFQMEAIDAALRRLREEGSVAAPGFMKPEGVVVFHTAANMCFKKTLEKDEQPKGADR